MLVVLTLSDAVVLWDWIISLPREYRFVGVNSCAYIHLLTLFFRFGGPGGLQSRWHTSSAGNLV